MGIRPAMLQLGVRLATRSYFVLLPVYDAAASERHWRTMLTLVEAKLKRCAEPMAADPPPVQ